MWKLQPALKKATSLFLSNPPLKVEILSSPPPFLKIWLEAQPPPTLQKGGGGRVHTMAQQPNNISQPTCYGASINKIFSFLDFAFKGRTQSKISFNNYGLANWCKSTKYFVFDFSSLKKLLNILLEISTLPLQIKFFNK